MSSEKHECNTEVQPQKIDYSPYARSRVAYVIEALVEYLITLTVAGAFIAKVSSELGISDGLTGIISSISSLGGCFQLVCLFIARNGSDKRPTSRAMFLGNLFFSLVYVIPLVMVLK